jgi:hypothetical protein
MEVRAARAFGVDNGAANSGLDIVTGIVDAAVVATD